MSKRHATMFRPLTDSSIVAPLLKQQLSPVQFDGLNWLLYCWYGQRSSILADEAGKKVQAIALLQYLCSAQEMRPFGCSTFLILAPTVDRVQVWQREIDRWANDLNVVTFTDGSLVSELQREMSEKLKLDGTTSNDKGNVVVIATIDALKRSQTSHGGDSMHETSDDGNTAAVGGGSSWLSTIDWHCVVVDRAHDIVVNHKELLSSSSLRCEHKLLLTDTPIPNTDNPLRDLLSLMNFVDPVVFTVAGDVLSNPMEIYSAIGSYMLRRLNDNNNSQ